MKRRVCGYVAAVCLAIAGACGVGMASSDVEKRVEEFKSGMEKKPAAHGEEAVKSPDSHGKASESHDKAAPAAKEGKKESGKHKITHAKKAHAASDAHKAHAATSGHGGEGVEPEEAIKRLMEGNKRYVTEKSAGPHRSSKRRAEIANGQHPFAVVVGCSDSRVPPELLFDQGFGDLFVVRTAGNVVDSVALGSIEYAVEHLGVQLIVVLGHERCGAVDATLKGGEAPANIKTLVEAIKPAVEKAKEKGHGGHGCDLLCSSVKANVKLVAEKMRTSPILKEFMENGMLRVVGGYYDLDNGAVALTYKPYL